MSIIKVKPEYAEVVFGFNNSGKPLGQRDDLHLLVETAQHHGYQHILDMFEIIPSDVELDNIKEEKFNKKTTSKKNSPENE